MNSGQDIMRKLKKLMNQFDSLSDILLFIQILIFLTILPILISLFSLKKLMELLSSDSTKAHDLNKAEKVLQLTNLILYRDFFIYKNICLKRSLTLYYFLSRSGQDVNIYYGVKKGEKLNEDASILDGHSWIKLNGEIFNDNDKDAPNLYRITYSYPN